MASPPLAVPYEPRARDFTQARPGAFLRAHFRRKAHVRKQKGRVASGEAVTAGDSPPPSLGPMVQVAPTSSIGRAFAHRNRMRARARGEDHGEDGARKAANARPLLPARELRAKVLRAIETNNRRMLNAALRRSVPAKVLSAASHNNTGEPYLVIAARTESTTAGTVSMLIQHGADPDAPDVYDGITPLHMAVMRNRPRIAQVLIEAGCDVNAEDCRGRTPLMLAAFKRSTELQIMLMNAGANRDTADVRGANSKSWSMRGFPQATADPFLDEDDGKLFDHAAHGRRPLSPKVARKSTIRRRRRRQRR